MQMTSQQIRARLDEIIAAQAEYEARNLDDELKAVLLAGGDVDALELEQSGFTRRVRRLALEKQAFEALLPDTERAEAVAKIEAMVTEIIEAKHVERFRQIVDEIVSNSEQIRLKLAELKAINIRRGELHRQAYFLGNTHHIHDASVPFQGLFSTRLNKLINQLRFFESPLAGGGPYFSCSIETDI